MDNFVDEHSFLKFSSASGDNVPEVSRPIDIGVKGFSVLSVGLPKHNIFCFGFGALDSGVMDGRGSRLPGSVRNSMSDNRAA